MDGPGKKRISPDVQPIFFCQENKTTHKAVVPIIQLLSIKICMRPSKIVFDRHCGTQMSALAERII